MLHIEVLLSSLAGLSKYTGLLNVMLYFGPCLSLQLRRWADVFVIAPLDANTLAKLASGLCDNLLVSIT